MNKKIVAIGVFFCLIVLAFVGYIYYSHQNHLVSTAQEKPAEKEIVVPKETLSKPEPQEKPDVKEEPISIPLDSIETLEGSVESDALEFYQKGNFKRALELFNKNFQEKQPEEEKAYSLAYMAKCHEYMGNKEKAAESWNLLISQYPKSFYCGDAKYFLAESAETKDQNKKMLTEAIEHAEKSLGGRKAALKLGELYLSKGDKLQAWKCYSSAMKSSLSNKQRKEVKAILDPIVAELLLSAEATGCIVYRVTQGDNLTRIAKKHKSSVEMMRHVNKKTSDEIFIGRDLKVVPGMPYIEVYKNSYFLVVYLANHLYLQSYEIGLGKDNKTPVGSFTIKVKQKNPDWYTEEKGKTIKIPFNDPRNTLGTRWMGFNHDGIGIHGTKEPESIGKSMSNGCVRMKNEEVDQLFEIVGLGTQVSIHTR